MPRFSSTTEKTIFIFLKQIVSENTERYKANNKNLGLNLNLEN